MRYLGSIFREVS